MPYRIVDPASLTAGPGPHPAASPFDKRVSESLGVTAFEIYQVELPPKQETVRHNHIDDGVEDLYIFLNGTGWVIWTKTRCPSIPGSSLQSPPNLPGMCAPVMTALCS